MYLIAGFGVTVGFHRLLTHRAFQTHKPIEYGFAIAGSMSVQGPVIDWVADHRKHHAHADEEGDPHSPHVQFGEGWMGALKGLFHAHMGWLFSEHGQAERTKYAKDLIEDRGMRRVSRRFHWWVLLGLAIGLGHRLRARRLHAEGARSPACCGAASCASSCSTT